MKYLKATLTIAAVSATFLPLGSPPCLRAKSSEPPPAAKGAAAVIPQPAPVELTVTPMAEPKPALRFRLLPISAELNPGNAAPIYLRLRHELSEEAWKQIGEKHDAWSGLSLDKLPRSDARKFVDQWTGSASLLRIGTRRRDCDWAYPLAEQRQDVISILLPDCQSMRQWAYLLQIKARVETAEHNLSQAIDTIETGIAFGRHVGQGPFLINNLVGVAICSIMLDRVEEVLAQPDCPNLYWALTALPCPLVSIRDALETEQRMGENLIPELALVDEPHSRAEWAALLENLYVRLRNLARKVTSDEKANARLSAQLDVDLASFRQAQLAPAQEYLKNTLQLDPMRVKVMSNDEIVARALVGRYRDMRDDYFRIAYLPWREARSQSVAAEAQLKTISTGPLAVLAELQSRFMSCLDAQARLDRRVAALRVVEAVRLHAASHDGRLPEELKEIVEVPVPEDPATGKLLEYRREGAGAVLALPEAGMKGRPTPPYRITLTSDSGKKKP
jgi:hypothetical protein